jgi:YVTN family beta-propeller protein
LLPTEVSVSRSIPRILSLLAVLSAAASLACNVATTPAPLGAGAITATIPVPGGTYGIDISRNSIVYATVASSSHLAHISLLTLALIDTVKVGAAPTGVTFSPDGGTAYVTNQTSRTLGVVNVARDSQVATVLINAAPFVTLPSPDGSRLVVTGNSDSIFIVNTATRTVIASLAVGRAPNGLVFNTTGSRVYVSNAFGGTVMEVSTATPAVLRTFTTGGTPQGLALSRDGSELWVANQSGWLEVRSIVTGDRLDSIPLGSAAFGLARSPDDSVLYVGLFTVGKVLVVNRLMRQVIDTLTTGGVPRRIAFTIDGKQAVIANEAGWVDVVTR